MNLEQLRQKMHTYIEHADEKILRMMNAIANEYSQENDDEVVGYLLGQPITKKQMLKELKEAEAEIERGEYITIEELEKEAKEW